MLLPNLWTFEKGTAVSEAAVTVTRVLRKMCTGVDLVLVRLPWQDLPWACCRGSRVWTKKIVERFLEGFSSLSEIGE